MIFTHSANAAPSSHGRPQGEPGTQATEPLRCVAWVARSSRAMTI
jgi:hypothetical protein